MNHTTIADIATDAALAAPPADVDLAAVLEAWESATDRLQTTHAALRDEVRRLSDELERKNRELARKNRLADLGLVASHVAHEVRNSLVPMKLYLSLLRRQITGDATGLGATGLGATGPGATGPDATGAALLDKFSGSLTALEATVADLLHFSADRQPQRRRFHARELIDDACAALGPQFAAQQIELVVVAEGHAPLEADYDMLRRALLNLLLNALDVLPGGGKLTIAAKAQAGRRWELSVADTGPGIDATVADRVFEPFFSTKSGGTGLGLAVVARIAEAHGGTVAAENGAAGGAVITLRLPVLNQSSPHTSCAD
jgi:signal transduction histidine kinase